MKGAVTKVKRIRRIEGGLNEDDVRALEDTTSRPLISGTLTLAREKKVLLIEALYWGIRCMVEALTSDQSRMQDANQLLRHHA
jgi:hypothetical protein